MSNKQIKVTFKTLTPLWTGDAWGENREIRPSSIMGSLRFWFEVICYFAGVTNSKNYEKGKLKDDLNEKEFREKLLKNGADFKGLDKTLAECGISLPSRVFGCTGWKGWVRIKKIEPIEDYCFGNRLNLPYGVAIKKDNNNIRLFKTKNEYNGFINQNYSGSWRDKQKNFREEHSIWFLTSPYFYGKFEITFEMEEKILEPIFYPLLTFIEEYGFLGGKWNIGYGRVKIEKLEIVKIREFEVPNDWKRRELEFSKFIKDKKDRDFSNKKFLLFDFDQDKEHLFLTRIDNRFSNKSNSYSYLQFFLNVDSFYCSTERDFQKKISNIPCDIRIAKLNDDFSDFQSAVKELLKIKAKMRNCLRPSGSIKDNQKWDNFRHQLLGTTSDGLEGTKIIPWIYEDEKDKDENENPKLKGGFVSIAGILNLGGN